jgi:predicted nucleic acid-binding protein/predicted RNA-binding protein with PUA-like domain
MKLLIDTNILIHLEDNRVISERYAGFYNLALSNNCKILYHPEAIPNDISRDSNQERKEIIQSKLHKYEVLENCAKVTDDFNSQLGANRINDKIDNIQLFQLYKSYVDYFVTEDKGIHTKAKRIGLENKVLNISDILSLLEEQFIIKIPQHPILEEHSIRKIEDKFSSSFFDSLRDDYSGFDNWLQKCVSNDRKCYSLIVDNDLQALLIYNIENVEDHQLPNIYEKVLKICTLKVADTAFGIKLGELFLNKMFEYCINQKINYLYLTVFDKQKQLIELLNKFGFYRNDFTNKQALPEIRMIKCLDKSKITVSENETSIHPFYFDNSSITKYAIPIQPKYYSTLFKDGKFRERTLFDSTEDSIKEIQGNTILKAYISNAKIKAIKKGDLLLFYASKNNKSIEPFGIVETCQIVDNINDLWNIVYRKTVFSLEQLSERLDKKGKLHVITFRLIGYLKTPVKLEKIQQLDSFSNRIQSITKISENDYNNLKNEGYFDGRYIVD